MPSTHLNTDALLAAGTKLPTGHPIIDAYLCKNASVASYKVATSCVVSVSLTHPSVEASISAGTNLLVFQC